MHGAHEIIAEQVSDNAKFRTWIRSYTYNKGMYVSNVKDEQADEKGVYEMYYDFAEPVHKMVSHRILATNRGEKEDILKVFFQVDEAAILAYLDRQIVKILPLLLLHSSEKPIRIVINALFSQQSSENCAMN